MKRLPAKVIQQASPIVEALKNGTHWSQIGGRRLKHSIIVAFELRQEYRLICWFEEGELQRHKLLSHEAYNYYASNTRR